MADGVEEMEMKPCLYCKREIAVHNLQIHELHCQKHLTVCKKCGEAIPKESVEDHEAEFHQEIECELCHDVLSADEIGDHKKNDCPYSPVLCEFCDLECPRKEFDEHTEVCGSRTDTCDVCLSPVMLKDMKRHKASNCKEHTTLNKKKKPPTTKFLKQSAYQAPASRVISDDRKDGVQAGSSSKVHNAVKGRMDNWTSRRMNAFKNRSGPEPSRGGPVPSQRQVRPRHATGGTTEGRSESSSSRDSREEVTDEEAAGSSDESGTTDDIPCEFCSDVFSHTDLYNHQAYCPHNPDARSNKVAARFALFFTACNRPDCSRCNPNGKEERGEADEQTDYTEEGPAMLGDDVELPCQYCEKLCKPSRLRYHELRCPKYYELYYGPSTQAQTNPLQTIAQTFNNALSSRQQAASSSTNSAYNDGYYNQGDNSRYSNDAHYASNDYDDGYYNDNYSYSNNSNSSSYANLTAYTPTSQYTPPTQYTPPSQPISTPHPITDEADDEIMLPCEFCEKTVPHWQLYRHQAQCSLNAVQSTNPYSTDEEAHGKEKPQTAATTTKYQSPAITTKYQPPATTTKYQPPVTTANYQTPATTMKYQTPATTYVHDEYSNTGREDTDAGPATGEDKEPTSFFKGNRRFQAPKRSGAAGAKPSVGYDETGTSGYGGGTGCNSVTGADVTPVKHHPSCPAYRQAETGAAHAHRSQNFGHCAGKKKLSATSVQDRSRASRPSFVSPSASANTASNSASSTLHQRSRGIEAPSRQGRPYNANQDNYRNQY